MYATPSANQPWFAFSVNGSADSFGVYAFSGREERNEPYSFDIELVSRHAHLDTNSFLGKEGLLTVRDRSGGSRLVHGSILRMRLLHTANVFTHYSCELVPRFRFLEMTRDHKIYQRLTVRQIIESVLRKQRFAADSYAFHLHGAYPQREYCVQYGESDLHFISRLCEEEGIHFFFEHEERAERLCFSDMPGGKAVSGENSLRYFQGSGQIADTAVVSRLSLRCRVNSDQITLREWDFTHPSVDLTGTDREPDIRKAPIPARMHLETYQFPHIYETRGEGARHASIQLLRRLTYHEWIKAESDVSRFLPGFVFSLHSHPNDRVNRQWAVTSVAHEGRQPGVLEHEAPDDRGLEYKAVLTAVPASVRFVPEIRHPKVRIGGLQSAVVTGPAGEEVYCDKYGRVKVRFHWDREGKNDENTTCWVRVADRHAGAGFGTVHVPRIGQEVMVEFMEGDPDRPVITGRVYNAGLMPPYNLPGQKSLSGIQSREFQADRRNQLIMDDTQNEIQAQLSSDHSLSQLNLGYLTRIEHIQGRKDFRGEGYELRSDDWGVIRAARGMYLSTDARADAKAHHKDMSERIDALKRAVEAHEETTRSAEKSEAQDRETDGELVVHGLRIQADEVRGPGVKYQELSAPHIVLASPAGVEMSAATTAHVVTSRDTAVTSERHCSVSAGGSFLAASMDKVRLFASSLGMRFMAAKGKVRIRAHSDALDAIAEKVAAIISVSGGIRVSAPKSIMLSAGGSYLRISGTGIEHGTGGGFTVHAASHNLLGPRSKSGLTPDLPEADGDLEDPPRLLKFVMRHTPGGASLRHEKYIVYRDGEEFDQGYTDENGLFSFQYDPEHLEYDIEMCNGHQFHIRIAETHSEGREGLKERLARDGFRTFNPSDTLSEEEFIFADWEALYGEQSGNGG
jgi:type VI secretion system secreted protein VgrG